MKKIELVGKGTGIFSLVDDEWYDELNKYRWYLHERDNTSSCYAYRMERKNGKQKAIMMHRVIAGIENEYQTDHINGNGLDNRAKNLRQCTHKENQRNKKKYKNNKSGYKGVRRKRNMWAAEIRVNNKTIHLGIFDTKEEAAEEYNRGAEKYHKSFARFNEIIN